MRQLATLVILIIATSVVVPRTDAQEGASASSPYTAEEASTLSRVWRTIRGAARYEAINWQAIGVASEPGSAEARRLMAQNWKTLRGAGTFEAINWQAIGYVPAAAPSPTAPTTASTSAAAPATPTTTPSAAPVASAAAPATPSKAAAPSSRGSAPGAPPPAANTQTLAGTWVGTLETYPNFVRMTIDLPAFKDSSTPLQATLRVDNGLGPQGGPRGQTPASARFDPASRMVTLTIGAEASSLRLPIGDFYGFLDTRSETIGGVFSNPFADSSAFFVLARERDVDGRIFKPIAAALSPPKSGGPFAAFGQRGGTDRGDLERWARRVVDEYPDMPANRIGTPEGFEMARNLFADEQFEPHFGSPFDRMDGGDRQRVITGIRTVPMTAGNTPQDKLNAVLRTVERPFAQGLGTGAAPDMVLSVIAMRYITAWRQGELAELARSGETLDAFKAASAVDIAGAKLARYLWPSERAAFAAATTASLDRTARAPLATEVDKLLANANGIEGIRALDSALRISPDAPKSAMELAARAAPGGPSYVPSNVRSQVPPPVPPPKAVGLVDLARWAPATWVQQKARLNTGLDDLLGKQVADGRATLGLVAGGSVAAAANPTERLQKTRAWYLGHTDILAGFASRPVVASFLNDLAAQREADFAAVMPQMSARLASLTSTAEAQAYGRDLAIDLDVGRSRSWQSFEQQRRTRLAAIDYAAAVARVGPGPFGPEHPGAEYLNALYRYDTARLAQLDRVVTEPLGAVMTLAVQGFGVDAATSAVTGGAIPPGGLTQLLNEDIRRYSVAEPMAGFFIVAYERVYPKCMDPDPVRFKETITWETVVSGGLGTHVYPHVEVNYYNVNKRFKAAFEKVGTPPDIDRLDFTAKLFTPFVGQGLMQPMLNVTDAVHGMGDAMSANACDSALMKTLEKNLIAYVMSK